MEFINAANGLNDWPELKGYSEKFLTALKWGLEPEANNRASPWNFIELLRDGKAMEKCTKKKLRVLKNEDEDPITISTQAFTDADGNTIETRFTDGESIFSSRASAKWKSEWHKSKSIPSP